MLDPRTKDAIRSIPEALKQLDERLSALEELVGTVYKLTRSTNESVVRKYGGGKKNTVAKIKEKVTGKK